MHQQRLILVSDSSQIGEARRIAAKVAEATSLNETDRGRVAIVVTELATNLVRHGGSGGGHIFVRAVDADDVEVVAVDRGCGMDLTQCLRDGYSTGGTAGQGLGAIRRQSSEFDAYSDAAGSALRCEIATDRSKRIPAQRLRFGVAQSNAPREEVCGDGWRMAYDAGRIALLLVDGLGHGVAASDAAVAAERAFDESPFDDPETMLQRCHKTLIGTRGAAVATAVLDLKRGVLRYAGVGNISGTLLTDTQRRGLMSHNGIVGHQVRKIQAIDYAWSQQSTLVMHSDGVQSRWSIDPYPGLLQRHPSLLAAVLHRDFTRGRDDSTVAVLRSNPS